MKSDSPNSETLFHRNVAVLEFDSPERRRELLSSAGLECYVIRELTPTAVLLDPNKAQLATSRLRELGFGPTVQEDE